MAMNSREMMAAALRRLPTERIPVMPQICHDVAVHIYAGEFAADWIDGVRRCVENPALIYELVIRLARQTGCDGLRLFVKPDPVPTVREGDELIVLDHPGGQRIGRIDTYGGGQVVLDRPAPLVETLPEYRRRLAAMAREFSDEKMALLRQMRASVPDLFVASCPGHLTMDRFMALRGRTQAMFDLHERPDLVHAAMDMQVEAVIPVAEKLLTTGIDAMLIGDPMASASLISPKYFEKYCLPAYQKFCQHFKSRDVLIYMHICGNSRLILEMLADTGVHAVEPLDPLGGVSVADAKRRIGHRVALMGGVNTLTLAEKEPDEVRAEAIQKCREGGPCGYVLAAGDMVPPTTPLPNLQAMVDVATKSLWREPAA